MGGFLLVGIQSTVETGHQDGFGVAVDLPAALLWAQRAAAGGDEAAVKLVAELEDLITAGASRSPPASGPVIETD